MLSFIYSRYNFSDIKINTEPLQLSVPMHINRKMRGKLSNGVWTTHRYVRNGKAELKTC